MIELFWSRMQVELLDRRKCVELANALFDYLEIWHNRRRRHSQLGSLTPIEFERTNIITVGMRIQNLDSTEPGEGMWPVRRGAHLGR